MAPESEEAAYQRAGFGNQLTLGSRPAVIVVDLSLGFTDPSSAVGGDLRDVVANTRRVLDVARAEGVPIIFTTIAFEPDYSNIGLWISKVPGAKQLVSGTRWVEIDPRLDRLPIEPVVVKQGASACFGTTLLELLKELHVDTAIVTGTSTSGCVRATVVDLFQAEVPVLVPSECVGDRFSSSHDAALFDLNAKYADVVTTVEACDFLRTVHPSDSDPTTNQPTPRKTENQ
ncbi:nicotinamidase-related amidase [Nocardioides ginsengisegetis]|uniref:Nicotinamidase-related amidase n=1 Tax=Nocardioides ginsengisegetis TaxID=661491 RepID=A0A7W3IZ25_9ACTN|nr:isochorismatase family protein [Nocardioides ginsengisegetis]MBA8803272.1 nicotinamidase-related amidase [Nocardioides ginsengisegetis]